MEAGERRSLVTPRNLRLQRAAGLPALPSTPPTPQVQESSTTPAPPPPQEDPLPPPPPEDAIPPPPPKSQSSEIPPPPKKAVSCDIPPPPPRRPRAVQIGGVTTGVNSAPEITRVRSTKARTARSTTFGSPVANRKKQLRRSNSDPDLPAGQKTKQRPSKDRRKSLIFGGSKISKKETFSEPKKEKITNEDAEMIKELSKSGCGSQKEISKWLRKWKAKVGGMDSYIGETSQMLNVLIDFGYFEILQQQHEQALKKTYGERDNTDLVTHTYKIYEDPHTQCEMAKVMLKHLDLDELEAVEFPSFVRGVLAQCEAKNAKDKKKLEFQLLDPSETGFVTLERLRHHHNTSVLMQRVVAFNTQKGVLANSLEHSLKTARIKNGRTIEPVHEEMINNLRTDLIVSMDPVITRCLEEPLNEALHEAALNAYFARMKSNDGKVTQGDYIAAETDESEEANAGYHAALGALLQESATRMVTGIVQIFQQVQANIMRHSVYRTLLA